MPLRNAVATRKTKQHRWHPWFADSSQTYARNRRDHSMQDAALDRVILQRMNLAIWNCRSTSRFSTMPLREAEPFLESRPVYAAVHFLPKLPLRPFQRVVQLL
jgi:hypothetical protein